MARKKLLLLELNELSFDHVRFYCDRGDLPNISMLIDRHGLARTVSERKYEELEPWIQWVTAHTGLSLAEHGVFRLGDIVNHDIPQIWEILEASGFRVGAISPMNAKNRVRNAAFFVPDPWTRTTITGPSTLVAMYRAIAQAVNDNAKSRLKIGSILRLLAGFARFARPVNYAKYVALAASARSRPWRRAMFLDLLLSDVFIRAVAKHETEFASLFVNAAAHIQHHYLFSAQSYEGSNRNPEWYISGSHDPVREVYALYDRVVGQVIKAFPQARLMIATGLHQDPHGSVTYYWRLEDHARFLRRIAVDFVDVEPLMSRDFRIQCASAGAAAEAHTRLAAAVAQDGLPLFEVDNRGTDLFVMLSYPREITAETTFSIADKKYTFLRDEVVFVALKNGQHNGIGYFIDTGNVRHALESEFPLSELNAKILQAFGLPSERKGLL